MEKLKKPLIATFVQIFAFYMILNSAADMGRGLKMQSLPAGMMATTVGISVLIILGSAVVIAILGKPLPRKKGSISLYLWAMLLAYPAINVAQYVGAFVPDHLVRPEHLQSAALMEIMRYAIILGLILWVGFSKRLEQYLRPQLVDPSVD